MSGCIRNCENGPKMPYLPDGSARSCMEELETRRNVTYCLGNIEDTSTVRTDAKTMENDPKSLRTRAKTSTSVNEDQKSKTYLLGVKSRRSSALDDGNTSALKESSNAHHCEDLGMRNRRIVLGRGMYRSQQNRLWDG